MGCTSAKGLSPPDYFLEKNKIQRHAIIGNRFAETNVKSDCQAMYKTFGSLSNINTSDVWIKQIREDTSRDETKCVDANKIQISVETVLHGRNSDDVFDVREFFDSIRQSEIETDIMNDAIYIDFEGIDKYDTIDDDNYNVENPELRRNLAGFQNVPIHFSERPLPQPLKTNSSKISRDERFDIQNNGDHADSNSKVIEEKWNECLGYEEMVAIFQNLIVKNLNVKEILPHLPFLEDQDDHYEVARCSTKRAVLSVLGELKSCKEIGKWHTFIDALSACGYEYIVKNIRGYKFIDLSYQENYLKILTPKLSKMIRPLEILAHLYSMDVISESDGEQIETEMRNHGSIAATILLLRIIPRKHSKWYTKFIAVLRDTGFGDAADDLDIPELTITNETNTNLLLNVRRARPLSLPDSSKRTLYQSLDSLYYSYASNGQYNYIPFKRPDIKLERTSSGEIYSKNTIYHSKTSYDDKTYIHPLFGTSSTSLMTETATKQTLSHPPLPVTSSTSAMAGTAAKQTLPHPPLPVKSSTSPLVETEATHIVPYRPEKHSSEIHYEYMGHDDSNYNQNLKAQDTRISNNNQGCNDSIQCIDSSISPPKSSILHAERTVKSISFKRPPQISEQMPKIDDNELPEKGKFSKLKSYCRGLQNEYADLDEELGIKISIKSLHENVNKKLKEKRAIDKSIELLRKESDALKIPTLSQECVYTDNNEKLNYIPESDHGIY